MSLSPEVLWTFGGILALLVLATIVVRVLKTRSPDGDFSELGARIKTWWFMVVVFALALALGRTVSLVFFAFLSFLALKEYLSLIPTRRTDRRVLFWAYLAIPMHYSWIAQEWYGMFIVFVPVYVFLFLHLRMILTGRTEGFLRAIGTLHWGLMITVFLPSHAVYLLVLESPGPDAKPGAGLLLFLVCLTQLGDIGQYTFGKLFGKRRITPVSPKKTWGGFAGGVATVTLLSVVLAPWLTPLKTTQALVAGLLIGCGGLVGDLIVSAIKRDLGIKDTGQLLPGHGGLLDRIDSLTVTAPLFFHYVYWLCY